MAPPDVEARVGAALAEDQDANVNETAEPQSCGHNTRAAGIDTTMANKLAGDYEQSCHYNIHARANLEDVDDI
eukprot:2672367-Pyramimonas_sp.AAC.1